MLAEGADMIDVGGESTRPGAEPVAIDVELARVIPVIEALAPSCRLSIDTRHAEVARAAVQAGAELINDVSASLAPVAAECGVGWVAMHMLGAPGTMQDNPTYVDVVAEVCEFLTAKAEEASALGVDDIWIDPGFGFGKTLEHNLDLLAHLDVLVATGHRVVVGTSRKSMLGTMLAASDGVAGPLPANDRLEGSVATATYAALLGASMVRVHDVKATVQAMTVVGGLPAVEDEIGTGRLIGHDETETDRIPASSCESESAHVKGRA
jgi:dihydropteroate synthase